MKYSKCGRYCRRVIPSAERNGQRIGFSDWLGGGRERRERTTQNYELCCGSTVILEAAENYETMKTWKLMLFESCRSRS